MNKHCGCPVIYLGNSICELVKEVKYLGVMIHSSMKTTIDVSSAQHCVIRHFKKTVNWTNNAYDPPAIFNQQALNQQQSLVRKLKV